MSVELNGVEFNEPAREDETIHHLESRLKRKEKETENPILVSLIVKMGVEKEKAYQVLLWICVSIVILGGIVLYISYRPPSQLTPEESKRMMESMKTPFPDEYE